MERFCQFSPYRFTYTHIYLYISIRIAMCIYTQINFC